MVTITACFVFLEPHRYTPIMREGNFESEVGYRLNTYIVYVINSETGARSSPKEDMEIETSRSQFTWNIARCDQCL